MAEKGLIQKKQEAVQAARNEQGRQSVNVALNALLDKEGMRKRFNDLLGRRAPQFVSSIVSLVNADEKLTEAFYSAPLTVIQSALKAAAFDLPIEPALGYAYIVPFKGQATFILGWKGMHQLALRTGVYKTINVVDIREGELRRYDRLTEEVEVDFVEDEEARNALPVVGYVGYYRLVNGAEKTIYMTVEAITAHEKKFRKGQYMGKGWRDDWDAMARKTVYRQLIGKWGVMSIDYQSREAGQQLSDAMAADLQGIGAEGETYILPAAERPEAADPETGEVLPDTYEPDGAAWDEQDPPSLPWDEGEDGAV